MLPTEPFLRGRATQTPDVAFPAYPHRFILDPDLSGRPLGGI
jgi:hypothetical protein